MRAWTLVTTPDLLLPGWFAVRLADRAQAESSGLPRQATTRTLELPLQQLEGTTSYLDVLPSASLRFAVDKDSDLRIVYGRGLARPDPQDISAAVGQPDVSTTPATVSIGNPSLKAEHANNYDVLYERSMPHSGLLQAGYFYKDLSDPIVTLQTLTSSYKYNPGAPTLVSQPSNAGNAHLQGVELSYQQRMAYLPGVLSGAGLSANYSYTTSQATGVDVLRTDSPALLRQAPNSWNTSPTFDTKRFSMRVGMTFDDKMIYAYQYRNLGYAYDASGNPIVLNGVQQTVSSPKVGRTAGPLGDNYLYPHYQFDTQASYRLPWGFQVYAYGLNLNNEVFGFYNGSPQGVVEAFRPQLEALQKVLRGCNSGVNCPNSDAPGPKSIFDIPSSIGSGRGGHLGELRTPLGTAATMAETLLLEYTEGMEAANVGWGRVDTYKLREIMQLHTSNVDITQRPSYIARIQSSNMLFHVLKSLEQAVEGHPVVSALTKPDDRLLILSGHDGNIASIAGALDLSWLIDGRRDDTPPGGALVLELWKKRGTDEFSVRTFYMAQTLDQMRNASPLSLATPPERVPVFVPGCGREDGSCGWAAFQKTVLAATDSAFVR